MARIGKLLPNSGSRRRRVASNHLPSSQQKLSEQASERTEKKLWKDARCSVCMESPHNAVLLLCSSYHKGCRPYMCATSCKFSNCLAQYKKAYTKVTDIQNPQHNSLGDNKSGGDLYNGKMEVAELLCPLCRGHVKGWTVVASARDYLNQKKRSCMHDKCCYIGNYGQLRDHVKNSHHPSAKPLQVDPVREAKWKRFENQRERDDVISTIRSTMPGAVILGDYVLDENYYDDDFDSDDLDSISSDSDCSDSGDGTFVYSRRALGLSGNRISTRRRNTTLFPVVYRSRGRPRLRGGNRTLPSIRPRVGGRR